MGERDHWAPSVRFRAHIELPQLSERLLAEDFLVRLTGSGAFTGETEGVRWFSSLTLYQNLGDGRAFAYEARIFGESDHEVPVADYGLRAIYRRRIHEEWLFLELRSGITWPRETLLERRQPNWSPVAKRSNSRKRLSRRRAGRIPQR